MFFVDICLPQIDGFYLKTIIVEARKLVGSLEFLKTKGLNKPFVNFEIR